MKLILVNFLIFLIIILFFGCSSTQTIRTGEEFVLSEQANTIMKNDVFLRTSHTYTKNDSIYQTSVISYKTHVYHFSQIEKIEVQDRSMGALKGAGIGLATSAVLIGLSKDEFNGGLEVVGAGAFAIVATFIGSAIGFLYGDNSEYYFQKVGTDTATVKGGGNE